MGDADRRGGEGGGGGTRKVPFETGRRRGGVSMNTTNKTDLAGND